MREKRFFLSVFLVFTIIFSFTLVYAEGTKEGTKKEEAEEECYDPDTLVFAALSQERAPVMAERYEELLAYLSKVTGKKIDHYMTTSYAASIEAMLGGFVDLGILGPFAYVLANEKSNGKIEVFTTYTRKGGVIQKPGPIYNAVLVTKKGTGLISIESLKGKTLAFTDAGSTSGYLLPKVFFPDMELGGTPIEKYFGEVVFSGSHDSSLIAVKEEKVDAAFVATGSFERTILRGDVSKGDYNILWWSPDLPMDAWVWNKNLCDPLKEKIKKAFLTFHEIPESEEYFKEVKAVKFIEWTDDKYNPIRKLWEAKKKMEKEK